MWSYNNTISSDELYHHGVLGMKWGHRSARSTTSNTSLARQQYKNKKRDAMSTYDKQIATYMKATNDASRPNEKANKVFDKQSKDYTNNLVSARKEYKSTKKQIRSDIRAKTADLNNRASFGEKLMYNKATRRKAAKYIVDNNMSVSEATKKAKGVAWRNSAAIVAAYGTVAVAGYAINKARG